ncbi:MAG TPA: exodeoxyribonuclease III [Nanoarchaeota archaeon]|nr:exodeoxyribonuclease III [Candidatus Woesearchaeota archaeon]HIH14985.1 exodeoxyribonuclease III [Nanoarchaeota archaeon]HIH58790.1 exodeoxyribonuclease III [Nanoarchaeota archaeon]HII13521.1 exodeoxyribonuclease III [Nanoarchaeota archaeon]HIJ05328.1 exodeoxyribonuclease III [Nanoarchaeota archaeon]
MKIISWNVNGIRAAEKKGFVNYIKKEYPDILCIQETKAHKEQLSENLTNVQGYHAYFSSGEKKGYSGVLCYTKEKPISVQTGFGAHKKFDSEGRILVLEFKECILMNIYFPNGKASEERLKYKLEFYEEFLNFCKKHKKHLIVCGDVNTAHNEIDLARPKENENESGFMRIERDYLDRFIKEGFTDTFRHLHPSKVQYSWWSQRGGARNRNVGWRIDYFYITKDLVKYLKEAFIQDQVQGSDHCPIGIEIDL